MDMKVSPKPPTVFGGMKEWLYEYFEGLNAEPTYKCRPREMP